MSRGRVFGEGAGARKPVDKKRQDLAEALLVVGHGRDGRGDEREEGESGGVVNILGESDLGDVADDFENAGVLLGGGDESGAGKDGSCGFVGAEELESGSAEVEDVEDADEETLVVGGEDGAEEGGGIELVDFEDADEVLENLERGGLHDVGSEKGEELLDGGRDDLLRFGGREHGALLAGVGVAEEEGCGAVEAVVEGDERAEADEGKFKKLFTGDVAGFVGVEEDGWNSTDAHGGGTGFIGENGVGTA